MKTEENKKREELNDEELDNVSGGGEFTAYDKSTRPRWMDYACRIFPAAKRWASRQMEEGW